MRGRRPGKTGGVFAGIHRGFFLAENDADGRGSFAAVERSMSDRLLTWALTSPHHSRGLVTKPPRRQARRAHGAVRKGVAGVSPYSDCSVPRRGSCLAFQFPI